MENLWNNNIAKNLKTDLEFRVYTSNLLGQSKKLVLHGGGNTSVKSKVDDKDILYVKGSGWDLVNIEKEGFSPVELNFLLDMVKVDSLSDKEMVDGQREALLDKNAPNPSVEAILHAIIPFKYVDHTHSDAIVTISNSCDGEKYISELYQDFLILPYIMPGFILAKEIYNLTKNNFDWDSCKGIILHNHGIFTFDNDARNSYDKMIESVTVAENFLEQNTKIEITPFIVSQGYDVYKLKDIISRSKGYEIEINVQRYDIALIYSKMENLKEKASRGVLTPEHIIRTKRVPLILEDENIEDALKSYIKEYKQYFKMFAKDEIMLDPNPNYAVIKDFGIVTFGKAQKEADIISDIVEHTIEAVLRADQIGGYKSIGLKDSFDMEYWELEQIKLKK